MAKHKPTPPSDVVGIVEYEGSQPHKSFVPRNKQQYYNFYFKAASIHSQARCLDQKRREQTVRDVPTPDLVSCTYAVNPFCIDPAFLLVGTGEQEEIIDIQVDDTATAKQKECSPIDFWLNMRSTYPTLARNAVRQLLVSLLHGNVSKGSQP
ncbi:unnamed protein product [Clavelina lepadiformis]|uniref:HAT C-terminal dimerisation domain-containing protein n=1 Tax=Clavelina lepadiformis TaxID=159417 RepID=A0ABP0G4Q0_CLALP